MSIKATCRKQCCSKIKMAMLIPHIVECSLLHSVRGERGRQREREGERLTVKFKTSPFSIPEGGRRKREGGVEGEADSFLVETMVICDQGTHIRRHCTCITNIISLCTLLFQLFTRNCQVQCTIKLVQLHLRPTFLSVSRRECRHDFRQATSSIRELNKNPYQEFLLGKIFDARIRTVYLLHKKCSYKQLIEAMLPGQERSFQNEERCGTKAPHLLQITYGD